jgi:hypothetical protein
MTVLAARPVFPAPSRGSTLADDSTWVIVERIRACAGLVSTDEGSVRPSVSGLSLSKRPWYCDDKAPRLTSAVACSGVIGRTSCRSPEVKGNGEHVAAAQCERVAGHRRSILNPIVEVTSVKRRR